MARSHHGQGFLNLVVQVDSKSSNIGIAYIWKELNAFMITNKLIIPRSHRAVSLPWNTQRAVSIPPFDVGICNASWKQLANYVYIYKRTHTMKALHARNVSNIRHTSCPQAQYPPIARGNRHNAIKVYETLTPFHIGTRDGCFSSEGMVACKLN